MDKEFERSLIKFINILSYHFEDEFKDMPVGTKVIVDEKGKIVPTEDANFLDMVVECPVCGTHHLIMDACGKCGWEINQSITDPDAYDEWNFGSMNDYKKIYKKIENMRMLHGIDYSHGFAAGYEEGYEMGTQAAKENSTLDVKLP